MSGGFFFSPFSTRFFCRFFFLFFFGSGLSLLVKVRWRIVRGSSGGIKGRYCGWGGKAQLVGRYFSRFSLFFPI